MNPVLELLSGQKPLVMGILNITPDSFSDGGMLFRNNSPDRALILSRAEKMVAEGVDIFDIGGESTRPGAKAVSPQQEMDRVLPVLEWLVDAFDTPVSVDSSTPIVMESAASKGASMLNDVRAFSRDGALQVAAKIQLPVCIMHMQGEPQVMQQNPEYKDVVAEVLEYLGNRIKACLQAGIDASNIIIDPGFGFGKTLAHNLSLFRSLPDFVTLGCPLLVGVSRKSFIGALLGGKPVEERVNGSVAMAMMAVQRGARMVRVHDVGATVDALKIMRAIERND